MGARLIWTILFLAVVAVTASQERVRFVKTNGGSGVKCGRSGRQCVSGTRCSRNQCRCPSGYTGKAEFQCLKAGDDVCDMTGDTRVRGFGGAAAPVVMPCSFRATRYVTRKKGTRSFCGIEVHVTNEAWRDTYRARAVHVSVGVTEPLLQIQRNAETWVTGTIGHNKSATDTYSYKVSSSPVDVFTWGSATHLVQATSRLDLVRTTVDDVNNFLILDIPACDTRIKFRTFDSSRAAMPLLPGVSIVAPSSAEFVHQMGDYPYSMCGRPADPGSLYKGGAKRRGLGSPAAAVLSDILEQRPPQFDNPLTDQCNAAMDLYASSTDQKADINACGFLLLKKPARRCLQTNQLVPLEVFNACLKARQTSSDLQACSLLQRAVAKCPNRWVGSKQYCLQ